MITLKSFLNKPIIEDFFCIESKRNKTSILLSRAFSRNSGYVRSTFLNKDQILRAKSIFLFGIPELWPYLYLSKMLNIDYFYADKGYFNRGEYFRITKNDLQLTKNDYSDGKRFNSLKIKLKKHLNNKNKIMICPQSEIFYKLNGLNKNDWINQTKLKIRNYSDREIVIHEKNPKNTVDFFEYNLRDIHCVVVYTSNAGIQAAINGVPCLATAPCASKLVSIQDFCNIENPYIPENLYDVCSHLADNQWNVNEIMNRLPHIKFGI